MYLRKINKYEPLGKKPVISLTRKFPKYPEHYFYFCDNTFKIFIVMWLNIISNQNYQVWWKIICVYQSKTCFLSFLLEFLKHRMDFTCNTGSEIFWYCFMLTGHVMHFLDHLQEPLCRWKSTIDKKELWSRWRMLGNPTTSSLIISHRNFSNNE